ncbi:phosphodiesterase [Uliginosibacterium sp. sgz301328]|uniref:phosphodiesterase n=1 Tax=Uliginosibacterium sp. sgz301328 TaxID=3243764 RepID=UPI00359E7A9C
MLIAQISDSHVVPAGGLASGIVDTGRMLADCVRTLVAFSPRPDLLVLTGDLVDTGAPEEYSRLRELLQPLGMPMLAIPGNHDERAAMRAAFADQGWFEDEEFLHYVVQRGALRVVALDTVVPGEGRGELCPRRLAWLARTLAAQPSMPTLVLMHHPPFETGIGFMDALGLTGRDAFEEVVARHSQIRLILCGHLHRSIQTTVSGCRVLTAPSPAHQVTLDLRADGPETFIMEPPGFMLHRWTGRQFVSHLAFTGPFAGPYPFA